MGGGGEGGGVDVCVCMYVRPTVCTVYGCVCVSVLCVYGSGFGLGPLFRYNTIQYHT